MTTDYKTDEEKAEELKAWWKEHGNSILAGVGLAIVVLFGYDYWKDSKVEAAEEASAIYSEVQRDESGIVPEDKLKQLQDDYEGTPYASLASLDDARGYAEAGDYERAAKSLQWVIDNGVQAEVQNVARLRLARVLIAQNKLDDAMGLAQYEYPAAYLALAEELKGDVHVARKEIKEARVAYDKAILNAQGASELIQLKRDNLGSEAATEAKS